METSLLSILPNLSIGVISILGLIYVVLKFLDALDRREVIMRGVEKDVRDSLYKHLSESTNALQENTRILGRVLNHLDAN